MAGRELNEKSLADFKKACKDQTIQIIPTKLYEAIRLTMEKLYPPAELPPWVDPPVFYDHLSSKMTKTQITFLYDHISASCDLSSNYRDFLIIDLPFDAIFPLLLKGVDPENWVEAVYVTLPPDIYRF